MTVPDHLGYGVEPIDDAQQYLIYDGFEHTQHFWNGEKFKLNLESDPQRRQFNLTWKACSPFQATVDILGRDTFTPKEVEQNYPTNTEHVATVHIPWGFRVRTLISPAPRKIAVLSPLATPQLTPSHSAKNSPDGSYEGSQCSCLACSSS